MGGGYTMYLRISLTEEVPTLSDTENGSSKIYNVNLVPEDTMIDYYEDLIVPVVDALVNKLRQDYEYDEDQ